MLVGAVVVASLVGIFFLASGCSRGSNKPAASVQPAYQPSTPAPALPASSLVSPPPVPKPATKKRRQRTTAAYTNQEYGIYFRYPKYDKLKQGEKATLEWDGLGPVEMNFVQPGGTLLSAVELPRTLYPGTDFHSAFFNLSVNPSLTSAQCQQFAFADENAPRDGRIPGDDPATPSKVKVGATEFNAWEGSGGAAEKQADAKYYHLFQNGNCYEFVLGLETAPVDATQKIKPVDRDQVFRKLNWILSTVKIQPSDLPAKAAPEKPVPQVAAGTTNTPTPDGSRN
jgi:hypothetical protein